MADLGFTVDETFKPENDGNFEPLPDGWYDFVVESAEVVPTSGGGKRVKIKIKVISEKFTNRLIFGSYTIEDPRPGDNYQTSVRIGKEGLYKLSTACVVSSLRNTDQIVNKRFSGKLKTKPGQDGHDPQNELCGYRPIAGGGASSSPFGGASAPSASPGKPAFLR